MGRENSYAETSVEKETDRFIHFAADRFLNVRQECAGESGSLYGCRVQLRDGGLASGSQIHFIGNDIGEMNNGWKQSVILRFGRTVMILHRGDKASGKSPFGEYDGAHLGVRETENLFFHGRQRQALGFAPGQNLFGFFGRLLVKDQTANIVKHAGGVIGSICRSPMFLAIARAARPQPTLCIQKDCMLTRLLSIPLNWLTMIVAKANSVS